MTPEQLALLGDNRLSEIARTVGLWITIQETGDDGFVEAPFDAIRPLLHGFPSDETIRRHLRMLTGSGWFERKPGGRGHGDRFRLDRHISQGYTLDPDSSNAYPPDRLGSQVGSKSPRSSSTMVDGSTMEESQAPAREDRDLSAKAEKAMAERDGDLDGCRGALRDYLGTSVPPPRQYGYVQTLVTWLDGIDRSVFQLPDGGQLPPKERTGYLALALNELLAGEESDMKRRVGDPGNLKTKLNILLKQRSYDGGSKRTNGRGSTSQAGGEATGLGRNHGGFNVERGEPADAD